jgi:hypothetical protein
MLSLASSTIRVRTPSSKSSTGDTAGEEGTASTPDTPDTPVEVSTRNICARKNALLESDRKLHPLTMMITPGQFMKVRVFARTRAYTNRV